MAAIYSHGVDKTRYGNLKCTLAQNISMNSNHFPKNSVRDIYILNTYSQTVKHQQKGKVYKSEEGQIGVAFTQLSKDHGSNNNNTQDVTCYHCEGKAHYELVCPKKGRNSSIQPYLMKMRV